MEVDSLPTLRYTAAAKTRLLDACVHYTLAVRRRRDRAS